MNEFENKLILKEEEYENGLFPKVPQVGKKGSAFILTGGCKDDICVSEHTTVREIRQGKYNQLVEISTRPYIKEIRFHAPGKETYYSFDVYVKAVIQVRDPISFYENKNIDVDAYFDNLFSLDVRKITQKYSVLNYEGLDDELTEKLSAYNTIDQSTGFSYQISAVAAQPGEDAKEYVKKLGTQQLDAQLKESARALGNASYKLDYEEAIRTEVAEGKLSELEAAMKIRDYQKMNREEQIEQLDVLLKKGFVTNHDVRKAVHPVLEQIGGNNKQALSKDIGDNDSAMDQFYEEEIEA